MCPRKNYVGAYKNILDTLLHDVLLTLFVYWKNCCFVVALFRQHWYKCNKHFSSNGTRSVKGKHVGNREENEYV